MLGQIILVVFFCRVKILKGQNFYKKGIGTSPFDLGDAFWAHPFAALAVPLRRAAGVRLADPLPMNPAVLRLLLIDPELGPHGLGRLAAGLPADALPLPEPEAAAQDALGEALQALKSLGYTPQEASAALRGVQGQAQTADELIRLALRNMAQRL